MRLTKEQLLYEKWVSSIKVNGTDVDLFANPTIVDTKNILSQMISGINIGVSKDGIVFIWDAKYNHPDIERAINQKSSRKIEFVWMLTYHKGSNKINLGTNIKPNWIELLDDSKTEQVIVQLRNAFPDVQSINGSLKLK